MPVTLLVSLVRPFFARASKRITTFPDRTSATRTVAAALRRTEKDSAGVPFPRTLRTGTETVLVADDEIGAVASGVPAAGSDGAELGGPEAPPD